MVSISILENWLNLRRSHICDSEPLLQRCSHTWTGADIDNDSDNFKCHITMMIKHIGTGIQHNVIL